MKVGYAGILSALDFISTDINQRNITKHEAKSICNKIKFLEFVFLLTVWTSTLERFGKTLKSLQSDNIDSLNVVSLYDSLLYYVSDQRNICETFLEEAQQLSGIYKFSGEEARKKRRKISFWWRYWRWITLFKERKDEKSNIYPYHRRIDHTTQENKFFFF